jgi:hypothetical protein
VSESSAWRAQLLSVGARSALVFGGDASSSEDAALVDGLLSSLLSLAGQRSNASLRSIKARSKHFDAVEARCPRISRYSSMCKGAMGGYSPS